MQKPLRISPPAWGWEAGRAKTRKETLAALGGGQSAEWPETLITREGGAVDLDGRAVNVRAAGRAAALGTSPAQEAYEVLMDIQKDGKITKISGTPIAQAVKEMGAQLSRKPGELFSAQEGRAIMEGLSGANIATAKDLFKDSPALSGDATLTDPTPQTTRDAMSAGYMAGAMHNIAAAREAEAAAPRSQASRALKLAALHAWRDKAVAAGANDAATPKMPMSGSLYGQMPELDVAKFAKALEAVEKSAEAEHAKLKENLLAGLTPEQRRDVESDAGNLDTLRKDGRVPGFRFTDGSVRVNPRADGDEKKTNAAIDAMVRAGKLRGEEGEQAKHDYAAKREAEATAMRDAILTSPHFEKWLASNPDKVKLDVGAQVKTYSKENDTFMVGLTSLAYGGAVASGDYFVGAKDSIRLLAASNFGDEETTRRASAKVLKDIMSKVEEADKGQIQTAHARYWRETGAGAGSMLPQIAIPLLLGMVTQGRGGVQLGQGINAGVMALQYGLEGYQRTVQANLKAVGARDMEALEESNPELAQKIHEAGVSSMYAGMAISPNELIPINKFLSGPLKILGKKTFGRLVDTLVVNPALEVAQDTVGNIGQSAITANNTFGYAQVEIPSLSSMGQVFMGASIPSILMGAGGHIQAKSAARAQEGRKAAMIVLDGKHNAIQTALTSAEALAAFNARVVEANPGFVPLTHMQAEVVAGKGEKARDGAAAAWLAGEGDSMSAVVKLIAPANADKIAGDIRSRSGVLTEAVGLGKLMAPHFIPQAQGKAGFLAATGDLSKDEAAAWENAGPLKYAAIGHVVIGRLKAILEGNRVNPGDPLVQSLVETGHLIMGADARGNLRPLLTASAFNLMDGGTRAKVLPKRARDGIDPRWALAPQADTANAGEGNNAVENIGKQIIADALKIPARGNNEVVNGPETSGQSGEPAGQQVSNAASAANQAEGGEINVNQRQTRQPAEGRQEGQQGQQGEGLLNQQGVPAGEPDGEAPVARFNLAGRRTNRIRPGQELNTALQPPTHTVFVGFTNPDGSKIYRPVHVAASEGASDEAIRAQAEDRAVELGWKDNKGKPAADLVADTIKIIEKPSDQTGGGTYPEGYDTTKPTESPTGSKSGADDAVGNPGPKAGSGLGVGASDQVGPREGGTGEGRVAPAGGNDAGAAGRHRGEQRTRADKRGNAPGASVEKTASGAEADNSDLAKGSGQHVHQRSSLRVRFPQRPSDLPERLPIQFDCFRSRARSRAQRIPESAQSN